MSEFTKGEWTIDVSSQCYYEIKADGILICHTPADPQILGYSPEEAGANARLITASPKLFLICRTLVAILEHKSMEPMLTKGERKQVKIAKTALAKVEKQ